MFIMEWIAAAKLDLNCSTAQYDSIAAREASVGLACRA